MRHAKWVEIRGAADLEAESYQLGECAAILNSVIEHDLLALGRADERAQQRSHHLTQCALLLYTDQTFAVLERPPVNGVAVVNLCNLVKELIETGALSTGSAQPLLQRLLALITTIPNETMSGGDGRVLSNVGNFLRMLMTHKPADEAQGKALGEQLMPVCRRVLAALNAEGFNRDAKNEQSLSNLALFLQEFHRHVLSGSEDESLRKSFAGALGKLSAKIVAKGAQAFDDRRAIDGLLVAFDYLQEQGLCENSTILQSFCAALRARLPGLAREKNAAPAPLPALDAALPQLTSAPALSTSGLKPGAKSGAAQGKRIPGKGVIVAPAAPLEASQIIPGTTYLRPTAGRGKFVRAGKAKVDEFSLAARDALVSARTSTSTSEEDSDEQEAAQVDANKKEKPGKIMPTEAGAAAVKGGGLSKGEAAAASIKTNATQPVKEKGKAGTPTREWFALLKARGEPALERLKQLASNPAVLNARERDGKQERGALFHALVHGKTAVVKWLLQQDSGYRLEMKPGPLLDAAGNEIGMIDESQLTAMKHFVEQLDAASRTELQAYLAQHRPVQVRVEQMLREQGLMATSTLQAEVSTPGKTAKAGAARKAAQLSNAALPWFKDCWMNPIRRGPNRG